MLILGGEAALYSIARGVARFTFFTHEKSLLLMAPYGASIDIDLISERSRT
jgi:hypothetical protein